MAWYNDLGDLKDAAVSVGKGAGAGAIAGGITGGPAGALAGAGIGAAGGAASYAGLPGKAADALGISGTDTKQLDDDVEKTRKAREALTAKLENAQPGIAPQVQRTQVASPTVAQGAAVAPAAQVGQTTVGGGQVQGVRAPTIAPTGQVQAQTIAAPQQGNTQRVQAATVGPAAQVALPNTAVARTMQAATVQRVAPVAAATIAPIAQAVAPTVTGVTIDTGDQAAMRARQLNLTNLLEAGASGTGGPTAAEALLLQQSERAKRNQMGLAVSAARGGNVGLAMREAARNAATIDTETGMNAAQLRAKEQQEAQGKLLQALEGARSQDIGVASKQADLTQQANLTGAELGTRVGLANLDVSAKTALTQAQLEQEARQADAGRTQQTNLTEAGFTQEAARSNQAASNTVELANVENLSRAQEANAGRSQQTTLTQSGYDQQKAIADAQAENARRELLAKLESDTAQANQRADLAAKTTTAQIGSTERLSEAELTAKVGMDNAARELQTLLTQAKLDAERGITNAQLEQQIAIKRADLSAAETQFNAEQANRLNTTQATITAGENKDDLEAIIQQRKLDLDREQLYTDASLKAGDQVLEGDKAQVGIDQEDKATRRKIIGGVVETGGTLLSKLPEIVSDKRSKKDMTRLLEGTEDGDDLLEAFDALRPYKFKYKDPDENGAAPGQRYGVMAQDLEKTPAGRSVVRERDGEKVIDVPQALGLALAAIAQMRAEMQARKEKR